MTRCGLLICAIVALDTMCTPEAFGTIKPLGFTYNDGSVIFAKKKSRNKKNRIVVVPEEPTADYEVGTTLIDVNRAIQCAENYGMCSAREMEILKHDISHARVKNLVLNSLMTPLPPTTLVEAVEYRVLEEELELQLALLKNHTPTPSLFQSVSEDSKIQTTSPHLSESSNLSSYSGSLPVRAPSMTLKDSIMDESILEPIMICMAIVALAVLPQLLS